MHYKNTFGINTMENLQNISRTNKDLFLKLSECNCKVTKFGKIIYEGKFNNEIDLNDNEIGNQIVIEFLLDDNNSFLCTLTENKYIDEMLEIIGDKELDEALKDGKTYNKLYSLATNLPILNIIENKGKVKQKGQTYKTLLENYIYENI